MKKNILKLLVVFNTINYTSLGFLAVEFGYTTVLFLVVPIVIFSIALILKK